MKLKCLKYNKRYFSAYLRLSAFIYICVKEGVSVNMKCACVFSKGSPSHSKMKFDCADNSSEDNNNKNDSKITILFLAVVLTRGCLDEGPLVFLMCQ